MTVAESISAIEGPSFRIETNVASDLRTFQRAVQGHPAVRHLAESLASRDVREKVLNRVLLLSRQAPDPRYENPADTPLSAYLLVLSAHDIDLGAIAADAVLDSKQCWWARGIAASIASRARLHSSAGDNEVSVDLDDAPHVSLRQDLYTGESITIGGLALGVGQVVLWSTEVMTESQLALAA